MPASRRHLSPLILPVATLAFVLSCRSEGLAVSPRVESLARLYAPGARLQSVMAEDEGAGLGFVSDSFAVSEILVRPPWQVQLLEALGAGPRQKAGRVEAIVLRALPGEAVARARTQLQLVLGSPPLEGCGGLPGVAVDQVLLWQDRGSGGVALIVPRFRAPGSRPVAELVFFAGRWHGNRFVYDYRPRPCAEFTSARGPEDHP